MAEQRAPAGATGEEGARGARAGRRRTGTEECGRARAGRGGAGLRPYPDAAGRGCLRLFPRPRAPPLAALLPAPRAARLRGAAPSRRPPHARFRSSVVPKAGGDQEPCHPCRNRGAAKALVTLSPCHGITTWAVLSFQGTTETRTLSLDLL